MGLFSKKPSSYLGVDIGAGSVKVVELKDERHRARLSTYGFAVAATTTANLTETFTSDPTKTSAILREVCARAKTETTRAIASLPVASVFSSILSLPTMPDKALAEAVMWEAKKIVPLPIADMIIDWKKLDKAAPKEKGLPEDGSSTRVLLTGASRALVSQYLAVFQEAGLELLSLETEAFALIRSLIGNDPSVVLIVDCGAKRTSLMVVEGGTPLLSRSVDVGGSGITHAIATALDIDEASAEKRKLDLAVTSSGGVLESLPALIGSVFAPVVQEIRYAVNLFQSQHGGGRTVDKVILSGGSALLPSMADYMAAELGFRVFVGDPWARTIYPVDLRPALDAVGPNFAVAVGLGMREIL
jgi:type IV pilus assembly protein PilM